MAWNFPDVSGHNAKEIVRLYCCFVLFLIFGFSLFSFFAVAFVAALFKV